MVRLATLAPPFQLGGSLLQRQLHRRASSALQVLRGNKRWFEGVSLAVISNTLWVGERVPCLTYGMRGMISLSIEVCCCHCCHCRSSLSLTSMIRPLQASTQKP